MVYLRLILLLPMLLFSASAAPPSSELKIALLPCDPLQEATPRICRWLDKKLQREFTKQANLISRERVLTAMKEAQVTSGKNCDDTCLTDLGKRLGADRVIRQSLFMQDKQQSGGTVWLWTVHQVRTDRGAAFGHFERMCMCAESVWNTIARQHAERLLNYDPTKRLPPIVGPSPGPTKGPVAVPGMVYIPPGEFVMGSEMGEFDEEPRHKVYLDAFYIDKFEVTNADYAKCVTAKKCVRQTGWAKKELNSPTQPVVGVGWYDGVAYCKFAGKRLPTEAEWEKAARGTDERRYPWGNQWHEDWVNMHHDKDGFAATAQVGSFPQNKSPYGVYDMAGNAWEWVHDYYERSYFKHSPYKNPQGPKQGEKHVMRGGSWMYDVPFFVTAFNRSPGRPLVRKKYVGFRCAMNPPTE